MQRIDSLLKHIVQQKDESDIVIQCVFSISSIQLEKKHIVFSLHKGFKKVKLILSGAQKTKLILMRDEFEKELRKVLEYSTLVL